MSAEAINADAHAMVDVLDERRRQDAKFGWPRDHGHETFLAVLTEEVGEVARAILEVRAGADTLDHLREEIVQVTAVGLAWLGLFDQQSIGAAS